MDAQRASWRSNRALLALAFVILVSMVGAALVLPSSAQGQNQDPTSEPTELSLWRVYVESDADQAVLLGGGYDLMEWRGDDFLVVLGEQAVADELRRLGLVVQRDSVLDPLPAFGADTAIARSFYGGYLSVDEHYAYLEGLAVDRSDLVVLHDYGDSWLTTQGLPGGNDLLAVCITRQQPGDCERDPDASKPRSVIMAAIHARELQTSEMAWRLIDHLVTNADSDPNIAHLLDTTEVWVIPVANPDGRQIVQSGGNTPLMQRKNANDTLGRCARPPTSSDQHGVDLNRNATFGWGGVGTSSSPCAQTYPGQGPASEPEQAALESLFADLWEPAPANQALVEGTFITIHSYGQLILLPDAGNSPGVDAWGFRMSHFNGYRTGPASEVLYPVTGTTDDHVYATYGVPSSTYELSPSSGSCGGFAPAHSCMDALWQRNRDALLYSLSVARAPLLQSRGPSITSVSAELVDLTVEVTATADDSTLGTVPGSIGRPADSPISDARYFVDVGPFDGGQAVQLTPLDGAFDEVTEELTIDAVARLFAPGEHVLLVQAKNQAGFWGPLAATSFTIPAPGDADQNGIVNAADVQFLLEALAGPGPELTLASDMNRDGSVDLLDALLLAQLVQG